MLGPRGSFPSRSTHTLMISWFRYYLYGSNSQFLSPDGTCFPRSRLFRPPSDWTLPLERLSSAGSNASADAPRWPRLKTLHVPNSDLPWGPLPSCPQPLGVLLALPAKRLPLPWLLLHSQCSSAPALAGLPRGCPPVPEAVASVAQSSGPPVCWAPGSALQAQAHHMPGCVISPTPLWPCLPCVPSAAS